MKKANGKQHFYLNAVLTQLQAETGLTFVAVCSGGAALAHPCGGAAHFVEMLDRVPRGVQYLVTTACGNDYYSHKPRPHSSQLETAVRDYCRRASQMCAVHLAVAGMPSDVWHYRNWMSPAAWQQYDAHSATFRAWFEDHGALAVTGASELSGIRVADGVGHVHIDSEPLVQVAYLKWVRRAVAALPAPPTTASGSPSAAVRVAPVVCALGRNSVQILFLARGREQIFLDDPGVPARMASAVEQRTRRLCVRPCFVWLGSVVATAFVCGALAHAVGCRTRALVLPQCS